MKNHCFVVLGMHRSATSLIAKGLHESGVYMGGNNMQQPDSANPAGYFEDLDFQFLNKDILARAGGSWLKPPLEKKILRVGRRADIEGRIKQLVKRRYSQHNLWGFKDPRTILTIKAIRPYLKSHSFVVAFRDPVQVANSLYARNQQHGTIDAHIKLAHEYNKRLLSFLAKINANWQPI